ncbi:hypothetical protein BC830DRAFT_1165739 [Chytriomyces sp. MP71]|nr:hypothetical protein BC830DRAFT_1165739 [Chytriomyces sp. MP71]
MIEPFLTSRIHVYLLLLLLGFLLNDAMLDESVIAHLASHLLQTGAWDHTSVPDSILTRNHVRYQYNMTHWIPLDILPALIGLAFLIIVAQATVRRSLLSVATLAMYVVGGAGYVILEQTVEKEIPGLAVTAENLPRIRELGVLVSLLHTGLALMLTVGIAFLHIDLKLLDQELVEASFGKQESKGKSKEE